MDTRLTVESLCGALRHLFASAGTEGGPPPGCNTLKLYGVPDDEVALLLDRCGGVLHVEVRAQALPPTLDVRPACSPAHVPSAAEQELARQTARGAPLPPSAFVQAPPGS